MTVLDDRLNRLALAVAECGAGAEHGLEVLAQGVHGLPQCDIAVIRWMATGISIEAHPLCRNGSRRAFEAGSIEDDLFRHPEHRPEGDVLVDRRPLDDGS